MEQGQQAKVQEQEEAGEPANFIILKGVERMNVITFFKKVFPDSLNLQDKDQGSLDCRYLVEDLPKIQARFEKMVKGLK